MSNFMKILGPSASMRTDRQADRQTDVTKLIAGILRTRLRTSRFDARFVIYERTTFIVEEI